MTEHAFVITNLRSATGGDITLGEYRRTEA
jgi:hypothetical protein